MNTNSLMKGTSKFLLLWLVGMLISVQAFAQALTVTGNVKDKAGEGVIGANIIVKGTTNGTITDFDGNFTLQAQKGDIIVISFIGYKTQELTAAPTLNVILEDDSEVLEDVVIIGYGVAKKNDLTGSVTAVKPDEMNRGLVTSAQDMMQGKIAGVNIQTAGGQPGGGGTTIRIRGGSSLNASNDPLIVIDGLAMDSYGLNTNDNAKVNPLSMINPNDIESFTILKDASATAIYGSRASNGVILITTKSGKKGSKPRVSYSGNVSVSKVKSTVDVLDGPSYMQYIQNIYGYTDEEFLNSPEYASLGYTDANGNHVFANTDWQDQIYRTAISTDHNITISGGLKNMPYRVSFGYTNQNGILKGSDYERYTGSINLAPSLLDNHLNIKLNAKGMYSKTNYADEGAIGAAASMDPTKPVYDTTDFGKNYGGYWQWPYATNYDPQWQYGVNNLAVGNPVAILNLHSNNGKSKVLMGNLELDYKIHGFEDLHLHVNGGMNISSSDRDQSYSPYFYNTANYYYGNYGWDSKDTYNLSLNAYAQYMKDFNEDHHFDIMAGYEWQHFHIETDYFYCGYYQDTHLEHPGEQYNPSENTLYKSENYLVSFFGRLNYSYKDKYLLTATLRGDGSSRFSPGNRWGVFPSVAFAWRMKEEAFLKDIDALSDMKLRLGYGITGQQEGIGDYTYFASYTPNSQGAYYPIVGDGTTYRPDAYNKNLTWEKTTTYNAGIDLGFWNNRLTANIDYYYRKTTDLINTVFIAAGSNFSNKLTSNIGSLHNQGVETALTWRPIQMKDWSWELGYNVTWNSNEIDELVASQGDDYVVQYGGTAVGAGSSDGIKGWAVGQPSTAFYTYQQVYDENGQPIEGEFVDRDGNGVINSDDRYFYKKADPDVLMGFTSKLIYKNWDFSFSLRASLGNYNYNAVECSNSNLSPSSIYSGSTWHNVLDIARPKNWQQVSSTDALSDYFIQNASYLKCDNITLGYSFDKIGKLPLGGRIYFTAQNVFTVTKYKGLDPEVNGGYDSNIYPRPFMGILGVNLNF